MQRIIAWWASNKVAANLLMLALLFAGFMSYKTINREIDPYVELPVVAVEVFWPGASPTDVEEQLIVRIEEAVSQIEGIDQMWAGAGESFGGVYIVAELSLDKDDFLQEVKREVDSITTFPPAAERPQIRIAASSRQEMMRIAVTGDETVSERELTRYAEKVRREIAGLPAVPSVDLFGTRNEEVSIEISEEALRRYGLSFADVARAVRATSVNMSAGNVRTSTGDIQLRLRNMADTRAEFEDIIVRQTPEGAIIRVRDVARVIDDFEQVNLKATVNGERAVLVQVMSGPNMDVVDMSRSIKGYLERNADDVPEGINLTVWDDQEEIFTGRMSTILGNFFGGLLLVMLVLFLFLRPIIAVWVSVGIAVAFAGGLAFLPLFDVSLNMISTFAFLLVIGIIVDDAIIVGEAIHTKTEEGEEGLDAAINGAGMVVKPVIFAVLTTMIFFAPWMFFSGGISQFTRSISIVVIMALLFSLVESLLILPAHLSHLKAEKKRDGNSIADRLFRMQRALSDGVVSFARRTYRPMLLGALKHRYSVGLGFICFFVVSCSLLTTNNVRTSFMPETESDQIEVTVNLPQGTPYTRTLEVLEQIQIAERELVAEIEEASGDAGGLVENWYTRSRDNQVLALVRLVPVERRATIDGQAVTAKDTAERLRELIGDVPDAENISVNYQANNNGPTIQYVLFAPDSEELNAGADDLMNYLRQIDGVYNVVNDQQSAAEEIQFDLKPGAEALGVTQADVAMQVRQGFYGEEVQRLPRDGEDVRVFVRYPRADRESLEFLKNMRIRTADGRELPLYTVADVRFEPGISQITRRERQRAVVVSAEAPSERMNEIRGKLAEEFFPGFEQRHPTISRGNIGAAEGQAQFMAELTRFFIIMIGISYFLLAVALRSYILPFIILIVPIPVCLGGVLIGHWVMGYAMSLMSWLGLIAAFGVAVNDNLVMIDYLQKLREKGLSSGHALVEAAVRRFRPILLTSITTFVGLLPLMLEKSIQAKFLIPMAIGLSWGVLFALAVTLFLVPVTYAVGADIKRKFLSLWNAERRTGISAEFAE